MKVSDYDAGTSPTLVASLGPKAHRASISGKKMTGRPLLPQSGSSAALIHHPMSNLSLDSNNPESGGTPTESKTPDLRAVLSQVVDWLQEEKAKRPRRRHRLHHLNSHLDHHRHHPKVVGEHADEIPSRGDDSPVDNETDLALEKLENILSGYSAGLPTLLRPAQRSSSSLVRKGSIARKYKRTSTAPQSSDTEFFGEDILVPSVEAFLDNSKTMAFTGGAADVDMSDSAQSRDYVHWVKFKTDIVRLAHTLKLKGWRRIPIDQAQDIEVARLSGALTNAVYVVRPPKNMSDYEKVVPTDSSVPSHPVSKRQPIQLLLRIYGPQVEHLIDRQSELSILRRLARKRIGPRLLGSFDNGRFEEYLHAQTLTAEDLRVPETSKQIAKRMRELHDGIELLESEIEAGPAVFINWDKWVDRCESIITWLDQQVSRAQQETEADRDRGESIVNPRYVRRGLICGVEWPVFRKTFEAYRRRVIADCGGISGTQKALVFAHNDTQYGNLMRLEPRGESPLSQPSNQHKQLVVIDFEYASQNTRGLEFANHFTEWCYNYHHADHSYACDTRRYPNEHEQYQFVRSYVMHRPQFSPSASSTPKLEAREKTNIGDFMLDVRTPLGGAPGGGAGGLLETDYERDEKAREEAQEEEIRRLLRETRVWRLANSAQWVAWGIVQAKIPELEALQEDEERGKNRARAGADAMVNKVKEMAKSGIQAAVAGVKWKERENKHQNLHPMSDPLDDEEKRLQQESHQDRPEGRLQEEAHHEGDGGVVVPDTDHSRVTVGEDTTVRGEQDAIATNGDVVSPPHTRHQGQGISQAEDHAHESEAVITRDCVTDDVGVGVPVDDTPAVDAKLDPDEDEHEEFDYLAYAQERAMFFWGDCIQMGLVKEEELPEDLRRRVKIVPY
ncbi:hypothetical protein A1O3_04266 [Capronia epimyces CBS 606.96]|uniref:Choline kinase N-terminal domain-containing protein n=1 Tax=Capronia epimyces CBS 606.96 TaxID=1182542 RepID=W9Y3B3_9EURO|nr:uncharacterized protein A1O3_04266 [Capronia epimyces CBS 606.96]EXJ87307.1 hypothetical protein A1O3_04266 [Capronia epimyces CBS 606.96]